MAKSVRNVMLDIPLSRRIDGMTMEEIQAQLMLAGYGVGKAKRRTMELLESAQIQTDGRIDEATHQYLFFFIGWAEAYTKEGLNLDLDRVGAVEWVDSRREVIQRLDGGKMVWDLRQTLNL